MQRRGANHKHFCPFAGRAAGDATSPTATARIHGAADLLRTPVLAASNRLGRATPRPGPLRLRCGRLRRLRRRRRRGRLRGPGTQHFQPQARRDVISKKAAASFASRGKRSLSMKSRRSCWAGSRFRGDFKQRRLRPSFPTSAMRVAHSARTNAVRRRITFAQGHSLHQRIPMIVQVLIPGSTIVADVVQKHGERLAPGPRVGVRIGAHSRARPSLHSAHSCRAGL